MVLFPSLAGYGLYRQRREALAVEHRRQKRCARSAEQEASASTMRRDAKVGAMRCGRNHCYFMGPFYLLMAGATLFYGLGLLALGPRAWTWLGLGLVTGTAGLWWRSERLWERFVAPRRLR